MVEGKSIIVNKAGMHARSASQFISYVNKYKCSITLIRDDKSANAKSILNLLMLGLDKGTEFTVRVEGKEEKKVLVEVLDYIKNMQD